MSLASLVHADVRPNNLLKGRVRIEITYHRLNPGLPTTNHLRFTCPSVHKCSQLFAPICKRTFAVSPQRRKTTSKPLLLSPLPKPLDPNLSMLSLSHHYSLLNFREENIDISVTYILSVQWVFSTESLRFRIKENKCVPSWLAMCFVNNNVAFCYSEVSKEVSNLTFISAVGQTPNLDTKMFVIFSDVVR